MGKRSQSPKRRGGRRHDLRDVSLAHVAGAADVHAHQQDLVALFMEALRHRIHDRAFIKAPRSMLACTVVEVVYTTERGDTSHQQPLLDAFPMATVTWTDKGEMWKMPYVDPNPTPPPVTFQCCGGYTILIIVLVTVFVTAIMPLLPAHS